MNDLLLRGTRIWSGGIADIAIRDGRIAAIGAAASTVGAEEIVDATGTIALPGLVDGHAHLDKTLWGTPWHSHRAGPTVLDGEAASTTNDGCCAGARVVASAAECAGCCVI